MDQSRDIDPQPPTDCPEYGNGYTARTDVEMAYRRGFHQGAYAALWAVGSGATAQALEKWLSAVVKWRRKARVRKERVVWENPPGIEGGG
jgi:hypothetical protein